MTVKKKDTCYRSISTCRNLELGLYHDDWLVCVKWALKRWKKIDFPDGFRPDVD